MSKINNTTVYPTVTPAAGDLLVITDVSDLNTTKTATISSLASAISDISLKEKIITIGYNDLSALNGGNTATTFTIPELTSTSALSIIDVTAYLKAGTTPFDLTSGNNFLLGLGISSDFKPKMSFESNNFINSSTSVYFNQGVEATSQTLFDNPSPLGDELSIKFFPGAAITQGNGTLTLKVLYRLIDFS